MPPHFGGPVAAAALPSLYRAAPGDRGAVHDVRFSDTVPDALMRYSVSERTAAGRETSYLFGRRFSCQRPSYWEKNGAPETIEDLAYGIMLEHPRRRCTGLFAKRPWQGDLDGPAHHALRLLYDGDPGSTCRTGNGLDPRGLILDDLAAGKLVNPNGFGYRSDHGLLVRETAGIAPSASMRTFEAWLMAEPKAWAMRGRPRPWRAISVRQPRERLSVEPEEDLVRFACAAQVFIRRKRTMFSASAVQSMRVSPRSFARLASFCIKPGRGRGPLVIR